MRSWIVREPYRQEGPCDFKLRYSRLERCLSS